MRPVARCRGFSAFAALHAAADRRFAGHVRFGLLRPLVPRRRGLAGDAGLLRTRRQTVADRAAGHSALRPVVVRPPHRAAAPARRGRSQRARRRGGHGAAGGRRTGRLHRRAFVRSGAGAARLSRGLGLSALAGSGGGAQRAFQPRQCRRLCRTERFSHPGGQRLGRCGRAGRLCAADAGLLLLGGAAFGLLTWRVARRAAAPLFAGEGA